MHEVEGGPREGSVLLPVEGIEVNECLLGRKGKDCKQRHLAHSELRYAEECSVSGVLERHFLGE